MRSLYGSSSFERNLRSIHASIAFCNNSRTAMLESLLYSGAINNFNKDASVLNIKGNGTKFIFLENCFISKILDVIRRYFILRGSPYVSPITAQETSN